MHTMPIANPAMLTRFARRLHSTDKGLLTDEYQTAADCMLYRLVENEKKTPLSTIDCVVSISPRGARIAEELARLLAVGYVNIADDDSGNTVGLSLASEIGKGTFKSVTSVLLVNETIRGGSRARRFAQAFLHEGLSIATISVLLDYELGARAMLESWSLPLTSVFTISELARFVTDV